MCKQAYRFMTIRKVYPKPLDSVLFAVKFTMEKIYWLPTICAIVKIGRQVDIVAKFETSIWKIAHFVKLRCSGYYIRVCFCAITAANLCSKTKGA